MKWDSSCFKLAQRKNKCELEKLKNLFEQHFNPPIPKVEPYELHKTSECNFYQLILSDSTDSFPISKVEPHEVHSALDKYKIKKALQRLKCDKATKDIPPYFLKYVSESKSLLSESEHMLKIILRTRSTPEKWSYSKQAALWKGAAKSSIKDPSAYREILHCSPSCKLKIIILVTNHGMISNY